MIRILLLMYIVMMRAVVTTINIIGYLKKKKYNTNMVFYQIKHYSYMSMIFLMKGHLKDFEWSQRIIGDNFWDIFVVNFVNNFMDNL